jgi:pimeloyl-ACP methyl ester carboxylesterase
MSSGIANVNGTQIWYELSGSGDVVVQIGGAVSAHEGYEPVTPEIAKHFTVLNYDHRGYGLSARPEQQYSIQRAEKYERRHGSQALR